MVYAKKKFQTEVFFSRIYKLVNTGFFEKKYKGIKSPAAGYLALQKSENLDICTRPTCRGILGDGIRKKNIFQCEVFFSRIYKLVNTGFFGKKI